MVYQAIVGTGGQIVAPLAIHDIVVSIDGKCVGGMSELSVQLLVETSGANLTVTVARYLHAETIRKEASIHEAKVLELTDQQCADKRQMDWVDAGITAADNSAFSIRPRELNVVSEKKREIVHKATRTKMDIKSEKKQVLLCNDEDQRDRTFNTMKTPQKKPRLPTTPLAQPSRLSNDMLTTTSHTETIPGLKSGDCATTPLSIQKLRDATFLPSVHGSLMQESDDGNAWFNCVCMHCHDERVPVFWVQCDSCCSWYNVARGCVGFDEDQAESITWICPGCPDDGRDNSLLGQDSTSLMIKTFLPASPGYDSFITSPEREHVHPTHSLLEHLTDPQLSEVLVRSPDAQSLIEHQTEPLHEDSKRESLPANEVEAHSGEKVALFQAGDRVKVKQHSWSYVNHPEGVAVILKTSKDEYGDPIYDIKYVIDRIRKRGVMEKYLTLAF